MSPRLARCHCGEVQLRCAGEPAKVSMCHCLDCQRRSGSPFSVAVFFTRDQVEILGETRAYTRPSASGSPVTFRFCPTCGSNLCWLPERMPHLIGVAIGSFGDPHFTAPQQAVWTKDRHGWLPLPEGLPCFDENPPPRAQQGQAGA